MTDRAIIRGNVRDEGGGVFTCERGTYRFEIARVAATVGDAAGMITCRPLRANG